MFISIVVCSQIKALYLFLNSIFLEKSYVGTGILVNCQESKSYCNLYNFLHLQV